MTRPRTKPRPSEAPLPAFQESLRYRPDIASRYLDQSRDTTFKDIKNGRLAVIREGGRTYVPGTEIARRCSLTGTAPSPSVRGRGVTR
jgi:hypothetical protein